MHIGKAGSVSCLDLYALGGVVRLAVSGARSVAKTRTVGPGRCRLEANPFATDPEQGWRPISPVAIIRPRGAGADVVLLFDRCFEAGPD